MGAFLKNFATAVARHWAWVLSLLAFVGLVAATFHFNRQSSPPRFDAPEALGVKDPAVRQLATEVATLEKAYRAAIADGAVPSPDALASLNTAVQKQRLLVRLIAGGDEAQVARLRSLESELDNRRINELLPRIARLAAEGEDALAAGRFAEAGAPLREALRLQHEVNASDAEARLKSNGRESTLQLAVARVEVEPVHLELETELVQARAAATAKRVGEAVAAFNRARALQGRINREFAGTPYASSGAVEKITAELASFGAAGLRAESDSDEQAGEAALAAGRDTEAAEAFLQARDSQIQINQKFPLGEFANAARVEVLETRRQTAASGPTIAMLLTLDHDITGLARQRRPAEAAQKISEAVRVVTRLFTGFPKSQRLDPALKAKVEYLGARQRDLPEIQRLVYSTLLRLPGSTDRALLKTEVTQALYELVAANNPSRTPAPTRPVDSVTWREAETFCQRLSWLLGVPARLPTEAEFRAALGSGPQPTAWSRDNSSGATQPVAKQSANAAGFSDLVGNVAEWLAATPVAEDAPVVGGSYLDSAAALAHWPLETRSKNDRARHIGFRFVVDSFDLSTGGPGATPAMSNAADAAQPIR